MSVILSFVAGFVWCWVLLGLRLWLGTVVWASWSSLLHLCASGIETLRVFSVFRDVLGSRGVIDLSGQLLLSVRVW